MMEDFLKFLEIKTRVNLIFPKLIAFNLLKNLGEGSNLRLDEADRWTQASREDTVETQGLQLNSRKERDSEKCSEKKHG